MSEMMKAILISLVQCTNTTTLTIDPLINSIIQAYTSKMVILIAGHLSVAGCCCMLIKQGFSTDRGSLSRAHLVYLAI